MFLSSAQLPENWLETTRSQAVLGILCEFLSESCLWNFNSSNKDKSNCLRHILQRKTNWYSGYESQWINSGVPEINFSSIVKLNFYLEGLIPPAPPRQQEVLLLVGDPDPHPGVVSKFQEVNVKPSFVNGSIRSLVAAHACIAGTSPTLSLTSMPQM